jgi:hypothetical protein
VTTANAPPARGWHTAVWTGSRMIVWGGYDITVLRYDGGQLGPVSLYRKN